MTVFYRPGRSGRRDVAVYSVPVGHLRRTVRAIYSPGGGGRVRSPTLAGRIRPSDGVALALLATTFAIGVLAYDAVPAEMVVHYTPPGGVYYGPETAPKPLGLFAVPVLGLVTFAAMRALPLLDGVATRLAPVRSVYQAAIVLVVGVLCAGQAVLVLLNAV